MRQVTRRREPDDQPILDNVAVGDNPVTLIAGGPDRHDTARRRDRQERARC